MENPFWDTIEAELGKILNDKDGFCLSKGANSIPCYNDGRTYLRRGDDKARMKLNLLENEWRKWLSSQGVEIYYKADELIQPEELAKIPCKTILCTDGGGLPSISAKLFSMKHQLTISKATVINFDAELREETNSDDFVDKILGTKQHQRAVVTYYTKPVSRGGIGSAYIALQITDETKSLLEQQMEKSISMYLKPLVKENYFLKFKTVCIKT